MAIVYLSSHTQKLSVVLNPPPPIEELEEKPLLLLELPDDEKLDEPPIEIDQPLPLLDELLLITSILLAISA